MAQRKLSPEEQKRHDLWTNKFPKERVIYNAQYNRPRDVRNFIFEDSYILEDVVERYNLRDPDDDVAMYKILMFVMENLKYTGDKDTKGQNEFWQDPEDTITLMSGDCEDGAILIKSLSLVAGIPDYKVRIAAGMVKGGGHAYILYTRNDDSQCILDWCYWPNRLPINDRRPFDKEENYYDIWFSFNKQFTFAKEERKYGKNT